MLQWLLHKTVKAAQYGQGIGFAPKADRAVLKHLKRSGGNQLIVFDVGANRGTFVQLALAELAHRELTIHAFEPSKAAFAQLSQRFANRNEIVLNNVALGNQGAEQSLYYDVAGSELSSLYPRRTEHHGIRMTGSEQVQVETLDEYCLARGITHIDLLKLDVEGHELRVLEGAVQTFEQEKIAMVSFEFGGCNIDSRTYLRDFFHFFEARGMQLARVTAFGTLHPIPRYNEGLEQFRTTCFVASAPQR